MAILLTGFDPFSGLSVNPSEQIVAALAHQGTRHGLLATVLATEFAAAEHTIRSLIASNRPQACLCMGVAPGTASVRLETTAWNRDAATEPDNAGQQRQGSIVPRGPDCYRTRVPLGDLARELLARDVRTELSDDPGTYVCNHVYYAALHEIDRLHLPTACMFMHLPLLAEQPEAAANPRLPSMPFAHMLEAVECSLNFLADFSYAGPA